MPGANESFRPAPPHCPGKLTALHRWQASRSAAARRSRAGWCRRRRAGCLSRQSTAQRQCCHGMRQKACTRISPVDASAAYLKHLRAAWDQEHPDDPFDRTGSTGHRARIVRCRRPRTDRKAPKPRRVTAMSPCWKSRRRLSTPGSSGIRTGGNGRQRRPGSGRRYRRRHYRFHSDRCHRTRRTNCSSSA